MSKAKRRQIKKIKDRNNQAAGIKSAHLELKFSDSPKSVERDAGVIAQMLDNFPFEEGLIRDYFAAGAGIELIDMPKAFIELFMRAGLEALVGEATADSIVENIGKSRLLVIRFKE